MHTWSRSRDLADDALMHPGKATSFAVLTVQPQRGGDGGEGYLSAACSQPACDMPDGSRVVLLSITSLHGMASSEKSWTSELSVPGLKLPRKDALKMT